MTEHEKTSEAEEKDYYKDSVDILGVSLDQLEEFMNPTKLTKNEKHSVERIFKKFEEVDDVTSVNGGEIDIVYEYCMKVINNI